MSHSLNFNYEEGEKISFTLHNERVYEGIFVSSDEYKITVLDTVELPKQVMPGHLYFYKKEILVINSMENTSISTKEERVNTHDDKFKYWTNVSKIWSYISVLDEDFYDFIKTLSNCDTIAINGIGPDGGPICLLAIATKFDILIINTARMARKVFKNGMRKILQSPKITKVIFNGASLVNCLFHHHNVKLVNYFDLQVADNHIENDNKTTKKISDLLITYVHMPKIDAIQVDDFDLHDLLQQPVNEAILRNAVKSVAYFLPLKEILEGIMLHDLYSQIDVNLNRTSSKRPKSTATSTRQNLENFKDLSLRK